MNFNERLNVWIKENGIKQSDIAIIAQVSKGYVSHVVTKGKSPSDKLINALVKMSGYSKDWWYHGKEESNRDSFYKLLDALISTGNINEDGTYDKDIELIIKTMVDREIKLKLEAKKNINI